jgi:hypothetical protein
MPIKFKCPHCTKPLQVKDHLAGKRGTCPQCKKALLIPTLAAKTTAPPDAPPPPEGPPVDVDAIAAAALQDEPTNGKQEVSDTIDFACEFCETGIHVPRADAGKRMQCPNPECKSIIKVPAPKEGQKKLPTVAQLTQPEKIDDAAWGTQTDKSYVHKESFKEAGALREAPRRPIGPREWIQRGVIAVGVAIALVIAGYTLLRAKHVQEGKGFVETARAYIEPVKGHDPKDMVKDPVAQAEVYRAIARYRMYYSTEKKRLEQLDAVQKALASVSKPTTAGAVERDAVERDLFLADLAVTATGLGGSVDEDRGKEKYEWKDGTVQKQLGQILQAIRAPEARAIALRALTTRLLELEQAEIVLGLAAQLSNSGPKGGATPLVAAQRAVLLLMKDKLDDKELPELVKRVGFAEFNARKGNLDEARKIAFEGRSPQDRLEACVGVADVLLQARGAKPADAAEFVDEALKIVQSLPDTKRISPWLLLQTIRLGARVKGPEEVRDLPGKLPQAFRPRAYLELLLVEADTNNKAPLGEISLSDIRDANADSPSVDLGWEALARQNARLGAHEVDAAVLEEANRRYRAMVHIGRQLSGLDPRR